LELPIEPYTGTRRKMLYWLYLIKDKVNKKLLKQEAKSDYSGKFRKKKVLLLNRYAKDMKSFVLIVVIKLKHVGNLKFREQRKINFLIFE